MYVSEILSRRGDRRIVKRRKGLGGVLRVTVLGILLVSLSACTSSRGEAAGQWTGSYFKDPESVWKAIELTLLELDYEVSTKNREDGVIRAESEPYDDGTVVQLAIDQVVRTEDQVKVFVKPSFGGEGPGGGEDLLKAAADAFMKSLNAKLYP